MNVAAFFDLDRTLIQFNSAISFAQWERKHKRISRRQLCEASFFSMLYHFDLLDMEKAYSKATMLFKGRPYDEVLSDTKSFFSSKIASRLQKGAVRALAHHRKEGHVNVLLSSTSSFQGEVACSTWQLDDYLTNKFPEKNGLLDGTFEKPLCYHEGKVIRAEKWAKEKNVSLEESYFYSDSITDRPMLERVGYPHVVNPDPKLKKLATKRGWPIHDWRR